jgi:hypothetical protein
MEEFVSRATVYRAADGNYHAILAGWSGRLQMFDLGVRARSEEGPAIRSAAKTG